MDKIPLIALLFIAIPEGLLLPGVGLSLMGIRPAVLPALKTALVSTVSVYLLRSLPLPFPGMHMIMLIIILTCTLAVFYKVSAKKVFPGMLFAFFILILAEGLFIPRFMQVLDVTIAEILSDPWLRIAMSLPQQLTLLIAWALAYKVRGLHLQHPIEKAGIQQ